MIPSAKTASVDGSTGHGNMNGSTTRPVFFWSVGTALGMNHQHQVDHPRDINFEGNNTSVLVSTPLILICSCGPNDVEKSKALKSKGFVSFIHLVDFPLSIIYRNIYIYIYTYIYIYINLY